MNVDETDKHFFLDPFEITGSENFAKISYDFNPIHIDVDYSRTTRYGRPIVHGVYVVMKVLEKLAMEEFYVKNLNVIFKKPVFYSEIYGVKKDDVEKKILVYKEEEILIDIGFSQEIFLKQAKNFVKTREKSGHLNKRVIPKPLDLEFEEILIESKDFYVSDEVEMARIMFPALSMIFGSAVVLELASLSNIVGVFTPGLNLIFKRLNIEFKESRDLPHYDVKRIDKRFKKIDIIVHGHYCAAEDLKSQHCLPIASKKY